MSKKLQECIEQEQRFQFPRFNREDVWNLGMELFDTCRQMEGPLAMEIRVNGLIVFRYFPEGTEATNQQWLEKKYKTVNTYGKSSYRIFHELEEAGKTMEEKLLISSMEYSNFGGGFPIRLQNGSMIGCVAVSGLPHDRDHFAVIQALENYWKKYIEK